MAKANTSLTEWKWRLADSHGNPQADDIAEIKQWTPVTSFPSVIHMELLARNIIPDPNIGLNERKIQWVGLVDWEYSTVFASPAADAGDADDVGRQVDLLFEGLDTFATVKLNGSTILRSSNMFLPARVPAKEYLNPPGEENSLHIVFGSAYRAGEELNEKYGTTFSRMRDSKRNHMRKSQYHWGWDWGPIMLTAGPYMPVVLETYNTRIDDVYITSDLAQDHSSATVSVAVSASECRKPTAAKVTVADIDGKQVHSSSVSLDENGVSLVDFSVASPRLWWSIGLGSQHLYTANVTIADGESDKVLDSWTTKFGIRTIEVIQRPLKTKPGKTFMFRVNGRDIFAQGANWIPADMLFPSISRKRYFDWIRLVAQGNMNMIRVWGGGRYETEDFLDACDEMGVLVWHDYALANGDYRLDDAFLDSIRREAEAQTKRLRNRASLALLAGSNEDYLMFDWLRGEKYDHEDFKGPFDGQPFPQRKIFVNVLASVAEKLAPKVKYWPNSPFGGDFVNDVTVGDVHQWGVWHLDQQPYQSYKALSGRFVSEFGMHGFPVNRTVQHFLRGAPASENHPQSLTVDCHNKGRDAHTRLWRYLSENFRCNNLNTMENWTYATQLLQSEAYSYALRDWKRMFAGPGEEECAGALIWQLNDVYPSTSWAFIDYFLRPKPAYYSIRRICAPISVGISRTPQFRWVDENNILDSYKPSFELFGHNTGVEDVNCTLELRAFDMAAGSWTELSSEESRKTAVMTAGYNTELGSLATQKSWSEDSLIVLEATLVDKTSGKQLARDVNWPEPFRYLTWPDSTSVTATVVTLLPEENCDGWEQKVTLLSNQPVKGVWIEPVYDGTEKDDDPEPSWEDNMIDLMPGRKAVVRVRGLNGRQVSIRYLADWEVGKNPLEQRISTKEQCIVS